MTNYPTKIILWAIASQKREGYALPSISNLWLGSRAYRNHNPLNLRRGTYTTGLGAIGVASGNFLVFRNYAEGFFGGCQFLLNACQGKYPLYNPKGNILDFYEVYAPRLDRNDPTSYAQDVAAFLSVPITTPIETLAS